MEIIKQDQDYTYLKTDDGDKLAVDNRTGERLNAVEILVPSGTNSYTPEQQRQYKERKEKEAERNLRRQSRNKLGNFYFAQSEKACFDVSPQTITRLIYLGTYLKYETRQLFKTQREPMKKSDLPEILNLSKESIYIFWIATEGKYIREDANKNLFLSEHFYRGNLKEYLRSSGKYKSFQQIYIDAVRKLYRETPITKHNSLGYIFKMLPYINWEYNILCWNPSETELEKIDLMNLDELCKLVGYDKSQRSRLMRAFDSLNLECCGKKQRFCTFVSGDYRSGTVRIFVNPHILYRGNSWEQVELLGLFFKDD